MTDAKLITTSQKLALACNVCRSTIDSWRKKPDMPGGWPGPWDPRLVRAWAEDRSTKPQKRRATTYQQRERYIVSQLVAAVLEGNRKTQAQNIEAFWDWYDALPDPPLKGAGYAAGKWVRGRMGA